MILWATRVVLQKTGNESKKNLAWGGWKKQDEATVSFPTKYCWGT